MSYLQITPRLSGPCLETKCHNISSEAHCSVNLGVCVAGRALSLNPLNPLQIEDSLCISDPAIDTTCELRELYGKLEGTGPVWSLYDETRTITVTATYVPESRETYLYLGTTTPAEYQHFIDGASKLMAAPSATPAPAQRIELRDLNVAESLSILMTATPSSIDSIITFMTGTPTLMPHMPTATATATVTTVINATQTANANSTAAPHTSSAGRQGGATVFRLSLALGAVLFAACLL